MTGRGHICLMGAAVTRNWQLVQRLIGRHDLTLVRRVALLDQGLLKAVDVIAVDCAERGASGSRVIVGALRRATRVPIVVLDGGLAVRDVAQLLSAGAHDYFSEPFNVALIAERLGHLARSNSHRRSGVAENQH